MNICKLFSKITESKPSALFNDIIGYNDVKRLVRMALDSDEQSHILLSGPPASAKTMFLESLRKLKSPILWMVQVLQSLGSLTVYF
jgi:predicted ATPase with chaperone activity